MKRVTLALVAAVELLGGRRPVLLAQAAGLTPPRQVWAAQTGSKELMLVWKRAPDAEGYRVSPVGNTPRRSLPTGTLAKNVDHLSISLFSPLGASYSYEITAVYSGGRLSRAVRSNPVQPVAVQPGPPDAPPSLVEATETKPGVVTVTWSKVTSATAYQIGRSVAPAGFKQLCQVCSTATNYVDRKVTAGAKHVYTVVALTPKGPTRKTQSNAVTPTGQSSDIAEADSAESVAAGPPDPPGNVTVVAAAGHSFELSWDRAEGATGYEISRRINNGEARVLATTTATTRYVDNQASVDAKGALSYGVTALNPNGRSEEVVASVHDTTSWSGGSKAAIDLKAAKKSANSVLLTWGWGGAGGLVAGHRYALRRRVGAGLPSLLATISGTVSSFVDQLAAGIGGNLAYFLEDLDGKGAASNPALVSIDIVGIDSAKARSDSAGLLPKAPSNLKAAIVGPDVVRLEWNLGAMAGAALETVSPAVKVFNVYRRAIDGTLTLIGTVERTVFSFLDHLPSGWSALGPMTYAVEAVNEKGASEPATVSIAPGKGWSDSMSNNSKGLRASATVLSPTSVRIIVDAARAMAIRIFRRIAAGPFVEVGKLGAGIPAFIDNIPPGALGGGITYSIEASNGKGLAEKATVVIDPDKARSDSAGPPTATDARAALTSEGAISLTWGGSGATSYQIERSLSGGTYELIATLGGTAFEYLDELEGLLQRHPLYRIIAVGPKGASQPVPFTRVFERGDSLGPPKARSQ
jgi:hypothetical protein